MKRSPQHNLPSVLGEASPLQPMSSFSWATILSLASLFFCFCNVVATVVVAMYFSHRIEVERLTARIGQTEFTGRVASEVTRLDSQMAAQRTPAEAAH